MEWMTLLYKVIEIAIIPLLGVLSAYVIKFINSKSAQLTAKAENEKAVKYINVVNDTITSCVLATSQTYVEALKKENAFTEEAQKEAFQKTYQAVMSLLPNDTKQFLTETYSNVEEYLITKIEAAVNKTK
jgi:hypothetical protein